jgi:hypothetical protein
VSLPSVPSRQSGLCASHRLGLTSRAPGLSGSAR